MTTYSDIADLAESVNSCNDTETLELKLIAKELYETLKMSCPHVNPQVILKYESMFKNRRP